MVLDGLAVVVSEVSERCRGVAPRCRRGWPSSILDIVVVLTSDLGPPEGAFEWDDAGGRAMPPSTPTSSERYGQAADVTAVLGASRLTAVGGPSARDTDGRIEAGLYRRPGPIISTR